MKCCCVLLNSSTPQRTKDASAWRTCSMRSATEVNCLLLIKISGKLQGACAYSRSSLVCWRVECDCKPLVAWLKLQGVGQSGWFGCHITLHTHSMTAQPGFMQQTAAETMDRANTIGYWFTLYLAIWAWSQLWLIRHPGLKAQVLMQLETTMQKRHWPTDLSL